MKLPKDLSRYSQKYFLEKLLPCVLLLTFFGIVLYLWGALIIPTDRLPVRIICYILILLLPFLLTDIPRKVIDRTCCGKVVKVEVKTEVDTSSMTVKPMLYELYKNRTNTIYLTVELQNGKTVRKKVHEQKVYDKRNLEIFSEGDRVFHLYGTKHAILLPENAQDQIRCAVCGTIHT